MSDNFDNEQRNRYYGIRKGDTVSYAPFGSAETVGEVIEYDFFDNNRVYVKWNSGEESGIVAEWCTIVTKVEDKE